MFAMVKTEFYVFSMEKYYQYFLQEFHVKIMTEYRCELWETLFSIFHDNFYRSVVQSLSAKEIGTKLEKTSYGFLVIILPIYILCRQGFVN